MGKRNRKCSCCSQEYQFCPTCWDDRLKPAWMSEFCCEECKSLWATATEFNMKLISKEDAQKKIGKLKLKPHSQYVAGIQRDLKNIFGDEKKVVSPTPQKAHKQKVREVVKESK